MKAWRVRDFGEPKDTFVLEEVAEPTPGLLAGLRMDLGGWTERSEPSAAPGPDWVIMHMSVAALALPDVTMSRGTYPVPVRRPYISGQEGVGVVTEASPARRHLIGKRVTAVTIQPWGSLAPVAVGVGMIFEVPGQLGDDEAAGFVIPAHTAYHAAVRRGRIEAGETVVVLGAAGGIGSAMVQLAAAIDCRVIAVVGGREKAALCRDLGAHVVIDHQAGDFVDQVRAATAGRGVDVVLDPVQGEMGERARSLLVPDGRHVMCGHAGGLKPVDPHFYVFNHTLVGATLGGYPKPEMDRIEQESQAAIVRLLEQGRYRPVVGRCVSFDDVPDAISEIAARNTSGRVVVRISGDRRAR